MNPVFVALVLFAVAVLWILLSFAFPLVGRFIARIWKDTIDKMNEE